MTATGLWPVWFARITPHQYCYKIDHIEILHHGQTLHRPIDVRFGPDGALYVLDFGYFQMRSATEVDARPSSGAIHRFEHPEFRELTQPLF